MDAEVIVAGSTLQFGQAPSGPFQACSPVRALRSVRDITIKARAEAHGQEIVQRLRQVPGVRLVNVPIRTRDDLSMAYTPGVARICLAIRDDRQRAFSLTMKQNSVAVVTDGTAVLGLGDIGPEAALPVMEGKPMLFKEFAGVDAAPRCFEIEDRLRKDLEIPVFHDDQHGTAVVVPAARRGRRRSKFSRPAGCAISSASTSTARSTAGARKAWTS